MTSFFSPAVPNTVITADFVNSITNGLSTVMSGSFGVGLTVHGGISTTDSIMTVNQPLDDYSTNVATTQWVKEQGYSVFLSNTILLPAVGTPGTYNLVSTDAEGRIYSGTYAPLTINGDVSGIADIHNNVSVSLVSVGTPGTYNLVSTDAEGRVYSGSYSPLTISGDVSGVADIYNNVSVSLVNVGTPGTYNQVSVDVSGRVIGGNNLNYLTDTSVLDYSNLPAELLVTPLAFSLFGQPPASIRVGISIIQTTLIANNFVGSQSYCQIVATDDTVFSVGYVRGNTDINIGTVTFTANSSTATFLGTPAILLAGDWLYLASPGTMDATLSTISVTLMGTKV